MLSITALSEGPAVMLGAIPEREAVSHTHIHTEAHVQTKSGETEVIMRGINPNKEGSS